MDPNRFKTTGAQPSVPLRPTTPPSTPKVNQIYRQPPPTIEKAPVSSNVTINIHFPKLKMPRLSLDRVRLPKHKTRLPELPYDKILKRAVPVAVVLCSSLLVYGVIAHIQNKADKKVTAAPTAQAAAPSFEPVVPKDKPELAKAANNEKAAYDTNRGVYSFQDTLLGTTLIVSQQPLPEKFDSAEQAVRQVAGSLGAKEAIGGGMAYMKTEAGNGSQTIVTSVKGLLIFIQSPFRHSAADWKNYIETLN